MAKTKWLSELEIDMCRVLLHSPARLNSIRLLQMQVDGMRTKLTCVIATKYGDLNTVAKILDGDLEHPCPLLQRAMAKYTDNKEISSAVDSAIVEAPQPNVIRFGVDVKPHHNFELATIVARQ